MKMFNAPIVAAALAAVIGCCGAASAQDQEGKPLVLTVRPSQQAPADDPRARQEKLLKRLEQSDYWVRSICSQCGDAWKHQIYAPFNPLDALGRNRISPETSAE
jgi:hypothetical protein